MYPENMVAPMRQELSNLGVEELKTPEDVEKFLQESRLKLVIINSVCGCAAGNARPAIKLISKDIPKIATVFAGVDIKATQKLRSYIEFPASSPAIVLFKGNEVVFMLHRHNIEGRSPGEIAQDLKEAFNKFI